MLNCVFHNFTPFIFILTGESIEVKLFLHRKRYLHEREPFVTILFTLKKVFYQYNIGKINMLHFFRKYQRIFFIFIAIVIGVSFSFFGIHQVVDTTKRVEDKEIGKAVDGSSLREKKIGEICRFISTDRLDYQLAEKGAMPNFFNDGVIRKDFFSTGIGVILASAYLDELQSDLTLLLAKHKRYKPYVHPQVPFISVETLWQQVLPSQKRNLDQLIHEVKEMDSDAFSLLVNLYLGETAFPPHLLRNYLLYQEKQYNLGGLDPFLPTADLTLFHCHSLEEWFGPRFIQLVAQFIHNASILAKQKGYQVTSEEARVSLIRNGYESLQMQKGDQKISEAEMGEFWKRQLSILHMDEKTAIETWREILLFRRLFQECGRSVVQDPLLYQSFHEFASETAELELYQLPPSMQLNDFETFMKLQVYLAAVAPKPSKNNLLTLPTKFFSPEEIKKTYPELLEKRFIVEMAQVEKEDIALNVSLKEMWEWQVEKENFSLLMEEFPILSVARAEDAEGYYQAIEKLTPSMRNKVDVFSRKKIVDKHPEWIEEGLSHASMIRKEIHVSSKDNKIQIKGVEDGTKLATLLETAPISMQSRKELENFSEDGETYYRFVLLDQDEKETILTFADANEQGILDRLLEEECNVKYPILRKKDPKLFKTAEGEWKEVAEVKKELGHFIYADVLAAIQSEHKLIPEKEDEIDTFYLNHRLFSYMQGAKQTLEEGKEPNSFLKQVALSAGGDRLAEKKPLDEQWKLEKVVKVVKKSEKDQKISNDLFHMKEKSWSSILFARNGSPYFFQIKEHSGPSGNFEKEVKEGQEILSKDAQRFLMKDLIQVIKEKNGIHLQRDRND